MPCLCALASIFNYTILLAVPTLQSRHSFWARCPPTFFALWYCITFLTPLRHLPPLTLRFHPFPAAQSPANQLRQIQPLAACLPASARWTRAHPSTVALSPNEIPSFLRPVVSLIVIFLVFSFRIIVIRSLRHFLHSSKRCSTVCLLLLLLRHPASCVAQTDWCTIKQSINQALCS